MIRSLRSMGIALAVLILDVAPLIAQQPNPLDTLLQTLVRIDDPTAQASILRGANTALKGRRDLQVPASWEPLYGKLKASSNEEVRRQAQALAVTFGGAAALEEMRRTLADATAKSEARKAALDSLLAVQDPEAMPLVLEQLRVAGPLRAPALRGLAIYDNPKIHAAILGVYPQLDLAEKRDALNTLVSRGSYARALVAAMDKSVVPRTDITAPLARQLQNIRDGSVEEWVRKYWGNLRATSEEKQKQIAKFKEFLGADAILRADAAHGRQLFTQVCAVCHTMFGEGGKIGPELPGSFEDVDYLLQNILDPNAAIGKDYQQTFITTKNGQIVAGIIASEDERAVVLKTLGDPIAVQRADIAELKTSEQSMMPEGLLLALDEQGVRDLFLYLRQRQQVPLPAAK